MAASDAVERSATQTRPLRAARKENMMYTAAASADVAQSAARTCLSLAQGQRACAPRSAAAEKFYTIKFPYSLCEMLVISYQM